jgi:hypothetical protein
MIDLAVLIANNATTIIEEAIVTTIDNQIIETDPQIAITVETLAWIGLIPLSTRKTKHPFPRLALEQEGYSNAEYKLNKFDKMHL